MLELTGVAGVAALAGCSESGGGEDGGEAGGSSPRDDGVHDAMHINRANQVPTNIQWNPSNPSSYAQTSQYLIFDRFAQYNLGRNEFMPYAIQDWEFGDESFTLHIREGLTWSNGDDVTAADIVTQLRIGMHLGTGYSDYTESVEAEDDSTVTLHFSEPVNETIVKFQVLVNNNVQQKESVFGEYLETMEEDEEEGLRQLQDFTWQDPITSGPFTKANASAQQLLFERRDDHPDSGNINFAEYAYRYIDGNQSVHQAMIANQIDSVATIFTPPRVLDQLPDAWQEVQFPSGTGFGLVPQHDHKHAGDRAVRQAIAYVLNREQIVNNSGPASKKPAALEAGIASTAVDEWLGDAQDSFQTYGVDSTETEKAATVLEEAGYSKSGGTWKDSDGQTVELPIQVPSGWSDWTTATQTIVDQLNQFGFDASMDSRSFGTLLGTAWPNGDFVLSSGSWLPGGGQATFPYFSLRQMMIENFRGFTYNYPAANENRGGSHADITVPARTGSGETTVNPYDMLQTMSHSTEQSEVQDISVDLAWVTNVDLPMIPLMEKQTQSFLTSDVWNIPEEGADVSKVRWPQTWLPKQGEMNYQPN
jgi:peptide/nickel transport system substrate-binding protein